MDTDRTETKDTLGKSLDEPEQMSDLWDALLDTLGAWATAGVELLPNLVLALLIVAIAYFVARVASNLAGKALDKVSDNEQVNHLLQVLLRSAIVVAGLFAALAVMRLDGVVTSLLAGVGVVGLALGFAFQDIAANLMSGVLMAMQRPFKVGDLVKTTDYFGQVEQVDLRVTHLRTTQGEKVLIPNKDVYNNPLVNYTESSYRRVDITVGVSYSDDLRAGKAAIEAALEALEVCDTSRPIQAFYTGFGGSSIDLTCRFWLKSSTQGDFMKGQSDAVIAIKGALDDAGLTIPFPIRTLDFGAAAVGGESADTVMAPLFSHSTSAPNRDISTE